jgi:hypothetical protein
LSHRRQRLLPSPFEEAPTSAALGQQQWAENHQRNQHSLGLLYFGLYLLHLVKVNSGEYGSAGAI